MRRYAIALAILIVVAAAGVAAWLYQLQKGLIVTNMRNPFTWGLYIATWAFYVGTAAGGLVVSSAIYLFRVEKLKPIAPVASTTAFVFVIAAMLMILPDLGRPDRILNIILHPQFKSMLVWDFIVLSTYAVLSAAYTIILVRPNWAKRKGLPEDKVEEIKRNSERWARILAPISLPFAILIHTVTAWVLATQLSRPWWYGGLLAPMFIAAALTTGPTVVILASLIVHGFKDELRETYRFLAKISAASAAVMLFLYYNDFVVRAWWSKGEEYEALRMVLTDYISIHLGEVLLVLAGLVVLAKYYNSLSGLVTGSLLVNIGVFLHRYLLIPPAYNLIPFRLTVVSGAESYEWVYPIALGEIRGTLTDPGPVFVSYWPYVPSPVEITITIGAFALISAILLILLKILPLKKEEA